MFVFTGSTAKGKMVAKSAAVNLVPCVLELGGKSPTIIDSTADVSWAAKKLLFAKVGNFGQTCIAPDFIMCHASKKDAFVQAIKDHFTEGYKGCAGDHGKVIN